jgi:predicted aspartyl protease
MTGATRRSVLARLGLLGVGVGGVLLVRQQLMWPAPKVAFPAGGEGSGWLALPAQGNLVELPARVGGRTIQAVVDSGAQYSAIDDALAMELRLPAATPLPMLAFGVSGGPSLTRAVSLDLDLGPMQLKGLRAATLNLAGLSGLTARPFSMLLGRDLLRRVVADIDFPNARCAFIHADAWSPPTEALAATVRGEAGAIMASVTVEGATPVEVMVDTGATGALALSEETARAVGLLDGRRVRSGRSVTLGGISQDRMVRARSLEVAGHRLNDVLVQIYSPPARSPVPAGLLGLGVLRRFRVALDHGGGRMFLTGPDGDSR